ncbi:hypothetical protein B1R32_11193 [Abditibacterium utsteinense]|uniref:FAD-binding protein n=1 Tax=Abditibacterium utsteinense TaxID=1960156 RepID=A0A2S8SRT9_9BACT|nr:FAD-dependent monooxygenase [Abditibacterium utsteinense]PQV63532.1 hypothetical protein B1R32_11193 [Abditibacterium utsteinense]
MTSLELVLDFERADDDTARRQFAAEKLGIDVFQITHIRVKKRSLDARGKDVKFRLQAEVYINEPAPESDNFAPSYRAVSGTRRVVIIGCGPAGMFAALRLIELGIQPIILERGKDVQARRRDLAAINQRGIVDENSNYCFGEGGAGTYSDGKLYTRATKRGSIEAVLRTLVAHGAPPEIMVDAHPHIGSNRLPKVVQEMRNSILQAGGEIHFETRVVDFLLQESGGKKRIAGIVTQNGAEIFGEATILATGHSARDIFEICKKRSVLLEAKPFAMGVRIEHPQPLIDQIQYRQKARDERLPAASYRLASTENGRGVFSFCMCPGGWIVPAATSRDEVVVNGMSLSRRDSPFANSGLVVAVETEDLAPFQSHGVLAGGHYQKSLEVRAALAGGGMQRAPGQRVVDFLSNRVSSSLPKCSYQPGLNSSALHELLPLPLATRLQSGLRSFEKMMRGYLSEEAVIIGVETRTSSPVRVPRDPATLEHVEVSGLFPCGEGAGYAGGIVSAAMDGVRVADACAAISRI